MKYMTCNWLEGVVLAQVPSDIVYVDIYLYKVGNEKLIELCEIALSLISCDMKEWYEL